MKNCMYRASLFSESVKSLVIVRAGAAAPKVTIVLCSDVQMAIARPILLCAEHGKHLLEPLYLLERGNHTLCCDGCTTGVT